MPQNLLKMVSMTTLEALEVGQFEAFKSYSHLEKYITAEQDVQNIWFLSGEVRPQ